jgi:trehalose-6-phosphate synthase
MFLRRLLSNPLNAGMDRTLTACGFYMMTAFPSFDVLRILPFAKELLNGMLGADMVCVFSFDSVPCSKSLIFFIEFVVVYEQIAFQSEISATNFLDSVQHLLGSKARRFASGIQLYNKRGEILISDFCF